MDKSHRLVLGVALIAVGGGLAPFAGWFGIPVIGLGFGLTIGAVWQHFGDRADDAASGGKE